MTLVRPQDRWQFWMDAGGTFTDCIAVPPQAQGAGLQSASAGRVLRRKVLSSAVVKGRLVHFQEPATLSMELAESFPTNFWAGYQVRLLHGKTVLSFPISASQSFGLSTQLSLGDTSGNPALLHLTKLPSGVPVELVSPEEAPLLAMRQFLGLPLSEPLPPCDLRLGTTRGTNALLTRQGAKTAWVTTKGFADLPLIGYQNRPHLFARSIQKPIPLHAATAEIDERILFDGTVECPLDLEQAQQSLRHLQSQGITCLAIALLHACVCPDHELQLEKLARELGFTHINLSHRVTGLRKLVLRGQTTLVDAYLSPVLQQYAAHLVEALPGSSMRLMTSSGGLLRPESFSGKDSVLSGPAGGILGFSQAALAIGQTQAIGFDMGGTSTDVARFDGQLAYQFETEKAGVRLAMPTLAIETIAAGGGSICHFDGVKLVVGPQSAGADPGPACYGRGGPLTVTDINLFLGKLSTAHFPFPLDHHAVVERLLDLAQAVNTANSSQLTPLQIAQGLDRIANTNMAAAVRQISVAQGYDPRDYWLVPFGAAAQQHACAVAEELGISQILCHEDAGILSARGIGLAPVVRHAEVGLYQSIVELTDAQLQKHQRELQASLIQQLQAEGVALDQMQFHSELEVRYRGVDAGLRIPYQSLAQVTADFQTLHQKNFGYTHPQKPLELVALREEGRSTPFTPADPIDASPFEDAAACSLPISSFPTQILRNLSSSTAVPIIPRSSIPTGMTVTGPALIVDPLSTLVLHPHWTAFHSRGGELLLRHNQAPAVPAVETPTDTNLLDPIALEVMHNHFTSIATQMGITLQSTASSINVKERLDFSCAIFTANADLVVNAPHIPVHLGAMSEAVREVLRAYPQMQPGDVFITNDPFRGGSHLPDVTVITPVFAKPDPAISNNSPPLLSFFTACRAHHAEIGGITPGSMPPFSTRLEEEGVLLSNLRLIEQGKPCFAHIESLLHSARYPSRSIADNLADIAAQVAANQKGAVDLLELTRRYGLTPTQQAMQHLLDATARKMRSALREIPAGRYEFADAMDDGAPICVAVTIEGDTAVIDFTGSAPTQLNNLNANRSIVKAAVTYVLRLLVDQPVPLCEGILQPITLIIPPGILSPVVDLTSSDLPAVVGGNVETSQRVVDVLLGALGLAAASQGTMNNLLFGDATFGYYETIGGGEGGSPCGPGADAVHTHMTNTRLTDPEVFESRFPVLLRQFAIRRNSGGAGQFAGGDGILRQIEFRRPLTLSLLTQRRGPYAPFGLAGGQPGQPGRQTLRHADGTSQDLPARVQCPVSVGDLLTMETPGGGGFGPPPVQSSR